VAVGAGVMLRIASAGVEGVDSGRVNHRRVNVIANNKIASARPTRRTREVNRDRIIGYGVGTYANRAWFKLEQK
jgi:hypothetical protein